MPTETTPVTAVATSRSSAPSSGMRYDIQGLRAIAVLTVMASHAGFRTASGGFIGVDVFFVISGFLITSLILREVDRRDRISLLGFYARRARRILPAATVVGIATVIASLALLPLVRAVEIIKDSIWAACFAANIRFAAVGTDYFAKGEPASPLQHYWSLSVEEQFYLVWPLMVLVWVLLSRGHRRLGLLAGALAATTLVSLGWSVLDTYDHPTSAYFSTFTRAWELGIGCLTAVLLAWRPVRLPKLVLEVLAVAGLVAIAGASLVLTPKSQFPGYVALVPVLGSAALLYAGARGNDDQTLVGRLLGIRPMRVVGDWSYSLYLWHWPILRIWADHTHVKRLPHLTLLVAFVLIFALAALTYRFVETPFRTGRPWQSRWRAVALYPATLVLSLAVAAAGYHWVQGKLGVLGHNPAITTANYQGHKFSRDPIVALVQASVLAARAHQPVPSKLVPSVLGLRSDTAPLGDCDYRTGTTKLCPMGDATAQRTIVVLGDSHARAWSPAIDAVGKQHGYRVYNFVYSGCSATQAVQMDTATGRPWPGCNDFVSWSLSQIRSIHPDLVILSSAATQPVRAPDGSTVGPHQNFPVFQEVTQAGYAAELTALKQAAGRVFVLGNTPKFKKEPGVCLSSGDVDLGDCLFSNTYTTRKRAEVLSKAAATSGATVVDAMKWFCWDGECPSVIGNMISMRDKEHPTPEYAVRLAPSIARDLGLR